MGDLIGLALAWCHTGKVRTHASSVTTNAAGFARNCGFEAAKGLLALAAACGIISLRHTDLQAAAEAFLLRHGIDPERHYPRLFIESVAKATNHGVGAIAAFGFAYALIRLAEGYGLWQGKHWAEWLAVISAGPVPSVGISALCPSRNAPQPRQITARLHFVSLSCGFLPWFTSKSQ